MTRAWFAGINQIIRAFSRPPLPEDNQVAEALTVLLSSQGDKAGMGFYKLEKMVQEIAGVKRVVAEHGLEINDKQLQQLMKYVKDLDELKRAQARFWMQIGISVLLIVSSIVILGFGKPSEAISKGLFALMGTVVGYWLR